MSKSSSSFASKYHILIINILKLQYIDKYADRVNKITERLNDLHV
jgi:hypothetical protein